MVSEKTWSYTLALICLKRYLAVKILQWHTVWMIKICTDTVCHWTFLKKTCCKILPEFCKEFCAIVEIVLCFWPYKCSVVERSAICVYLEHIFTFALCLCTLLILVLCHWFSFINLHLSLLAYLWVDIFGLEEVTIKIYPLKQVLNGNLYMMMYNNICTV